MVTAWALPLTAENRRNAVKSGEHPGGAANALDVVVLPGLRVT